MSLPVITPAEARQLMAKGARLIDIRSPDEFDRARIPGSENRPIETIGRVGDAPAAVYHCRSGMRTTANASRLAAASDCPAYLLEGGLEAWRAAGLPVAENRKAPMEIMRQVQITAGSLVVLGVVLGVLFQPAFLALSAFVGAGLMFAGTTGWCGMAKMLAAMPWNRAQNRKSAA